VSNRPTVSSTAVIVGAVIALCFVVAAVVVLVLFLPPDRDAMPYVALLMSTVGTTVAGILALMKLQGVDDKVTDLTNGVMDAKIRAGVADVLPDSSLDPGAADQIRDDRARRDEVSASHHGDLS